MCDLFLLSNLPTLPKQTQLQKSTLAIQVATPMLSVVMPAISRVWVSLGAAGEGIMSGLMLRSAAAPEKPKMLDNVKPALDRSMRYQRNGLARARVRET